MRLRFLFRAYFAASLIFGIGAHLLGGEQGADVPIVVTDEALAIHRLALLVDGHNDLPWALRQEAKSSSVEADIRHSLPQFHTDIPWLRRGGIGAQFWSAYLPASTAKDGKGLRMTLEQIDLIHRMVARYPDTFAFALDADSVLRVHRSGRIACLIGVKGDIQSMVRWQYSGCIINSVSVT